MATFAEIESKDQQLITRYLKNAVFVAQSSASPITQLVDAVGSIAPLPSGYSCIGYQTDDGTEGERSLEVDTTTSEGTLATTRSDRTSDEKTIHVVAQETSLVTLGLYWEQDLSGTAADSNGEFSFEAPNVADIRHYRAFVLGEDSKNGLVTGRFYPKMVLDSLDSENVSSYSNSERGVTLRAIQDDELGYDVKQFYAGPKNLLNAMGVDTSAMA